MQTIGQVQPVNKRLRYVSFLPKAGRTGVLQDILRDRASLPGLAANVKRLFLDARGPATVHRWVMKLVPLFEKAFRRHKRPVGKSWRMDQT